MNLFKWGSMLGVLTLLLTGCGKSGGGSSPIDPADNIPPTIMEPSVVSAAEMALVSWKTDEPATSQVKYGPSLAAAKDAKTDDAYVEEHAIHLTDLNPDKKYYLLITSADQSGNTTDDKFYSFTTLSSALAMSPLLAKANQGDTFALEIQAENVTDLFGIAFDLKFDKNYLEIVEKEVVFGDFLENPLTLGMPAETGDMLSIATTEKCGQAGADGSGTIVTVSFKAKKEGRTKISLTNLEMRTSTGESYPDFNKLPIVGGEVNIGR